MNQNSTKSVVLERTFDAPVNLVWDMWTKPEHFKAWYGPQGAVIPVAKIDPSVGGMRHVCMEMQTPNGIMQMWFVGEHLEVIVNERLVYTESMSDEHGKVMSPAELGMPDGHPEVTQVTVELEALGASTKMLMTHLGVPAESPGETGWTMALDKLAGYIASVA